MKPLAGMRLSVRLLLREWRAGELRILLVAIVIAVAASTTIGFFTDRLNRGLQHQSADFLGADLLLHSPRPVAQEWLTQAEGFGLLTSETLSFATMVLHQDDLTLASVKAVAAGYPLRGRLRTAAAPFAVDEETTAVPGPGKAWIAARLMQQLGLQIGDSVEVGVSTLAIERVLSFEPGGGGDIFGMAPRLLMNLSDVPATRVIQPGSRLSYEYLFAGNETDLGQFRVWLEDRLTPSHRISGVREGQRALGTALERAEQYLGLAILAAIVLAGVAIAMAARRYSERHFDMSALMRCLGASQGDLLLLYLPQLAILGVLGSALGGSLGWVAQYGLLYLLADLLPVAPSAASIWPLLAGLATGMITLAGFALPPVLRLKGVPPLRVLRRELVPAQAHIWLVYGIALAAIMLLMWRITADATMTLALLGGAAMVTVLLSLLSMLLLQLGRRWQKNLAVAWRFGIQHLWRNRRASISQMLAFGLALMAMAVIFLVRNDLMATWQTQLPEQVPNHFAINILPDEVSEVQDFLQQQQVEASQLYPMVRGRLTHINGAAVGTTVSKEAQTDNALNRELNLTWTETLQEDNNIVSGRWWQGQDQGKPLVSVEEKLAQRLGIELGDRLDFSIGSEVLSALVISIRTVQWDSFRPNFYMVFPPGVMEHFAATYMTSFYLPESKKGMLIDLVRHFPSLTILEMDLLIRQVERIFTQVTLAVEYVLLFVLLAGFAVLYAALQSSLDERLYEGALLRTLGASRYQLRSGHLAEFSSLGLFSGLLAAAGTECLAWLLYTQVLHLDYYFHGWVWILTPLSGAVLIGAAGYWSTRVVVQSSPMQLLKT